jgi:hypothetical protein
MLVLVCDKSHRRPQHSANLKHRVRIREHHENRNASRSTGAVEQFDRDGWGGEDVVITIAGHAVAQMVAPVSQQLPSLADLRASMPMQTESAGDFIRRLRDTDRY